MRYIAILLIVTIMATGCKKFITVDTPPTSISQDNVYANDATAASVLTGIYTRISQNDGASGPLGIFFNTSLSSDELNLHADVADQTILSYYKNDLKAIINSGGGDFWTGIYNPTIYETNAAIIGLNKAATLSHGVKQQLLGEAYFVRAFCYFYLVNEYGEVPLALTTDYKTNGLLVRSSVDKVYEQIISDLTQAKNLLSVNYLDATISKVVTARVRPTKAAAQALLARTYLYRGNYPAAEAEATSVIANTVLYDTVALNDVFKMNSKETIWALQPVNGGIEQNTASGRTFIIPEGGPVTSYLSDQLLTAFEAGDLRRTNWISSITVNGMPYEFSYKYKIGAEDLPTQEYNMVLRLGEVYLIRAEARARQGSLTAADDLNIIRKRAGLLNTTANTPETLIDAIAHERQVELFTEWGHRWFDLKRTGKINDVMSVITPLKGGNWDPRWAFYPILLSELTANPSLDQNSGYE